MLILLGRYQCDLVQVGSVFFAQEEMVGTGQRPCGGARPARPGEGAALVAEVGGTISRRATSPPTATVVTVLDSQAFEHGVMRKGNP